jgi:hypothetical protein
VTTAQSFTWPRAWHSPAAASLGTSQGQVNRMERQQEMLIRKELSTLRRDLDQTTALDLRRAIFGVYIATVGVALSF